MKLSKCLFVFSIILNVGVAAYANEVFVNTQDGETFVFEADPNESLSMLEKRISALIDSEDFIVAIPSKKKEWGQEASKQGGYLGYPRSYQNEVKPHEKDDIHFIVTSLADKSLITIAFMKGDLEAAGDRIDHLHPLRFLMTVFTDERLKVGIRNIRGRGWVWNHFVGGLKECLATETSIGNMKPDYISDFARAVQIDFNRIYPSVLAQNWDNLIEILIHEIPRKGHHDRYDN